MCLELKRSCCQLFYLISSTVLFSIRLCASDSSGFEAKEKLKEKKKKKTSETLKETKDM